MKKISLIIVSLILIGFTGGVLAQETELPDPGLTPDSPFYFLEMISEGIGTFFTFGDLKKAERYTVLAAERMAEAQAVMEKGKTELAEKTLERYENQLNKALAQAEKAKSKGEAIEQVTKNMARVITRHLMVLDEVLEKVPEEVRERIKIIKEVSISNQKNALKFLAEEDPEEATEINLKAAEARLNRAKVKIEAGETENAEEAVEEFENQHKFGEEISQIAQGLGKDITTVEQLVGKATSIHLEILAEVYEKAPEKAREVIEKAMEVSTKGHERAVEALRIKGAIDEVPEEVPMPEMLSEEVKERIKERVRQEIKEENELEEVEKLERERSEIENQQQFEKSEGGKQGM